MIMSFNSLQTGKPIQRTSQRISKFNANREVSIPFKRESLSKEVSECQREVYIIVSIPFKRESLSKEIYQLRLQQNFLVSIPFKRESLSKVLIAGTIVGVVA